MNVSGAILAPSAAADARRDRAAGGRPGRAAPRDQRPADAADHRRRGAAVCGAFHLRVRSNQQLTFSLVVAILRRNHRCVLCLISYHSINFALPLLLWG